MRLIYADREMNKLHRAIEQKRKDAIREVQAKRPTESTFAGNTNPCVLTIPQNHRLIYYNQEQKNNSAEKKNTISAQKPEVVENDFDSMISNINQKMNEILDSGYSKKLIKK